MSPLKRYQLKRYQRLFLALTPLCVVGCLSGHQQLPKTVEKVAAESASSVAMKAQHAPPTLTVSPHPSDQPLQITEAQLKSRLRGAEGVSKWEPSGVVALGERLWVVSDKDGWLASYPLPLPEGSISPLSTAQLAPPGPTRVKWEALEAYPEGGLTLLEAISRTVWWCRDPEAGCPQLTPLPMEALNPALNHAAPLPFRYLMFEALLSTPSGLWIGTRGLNAKPSGSSAGGLYPWSVWGQVTGEGAPQVVSPLEGAWTFEGRRYGLSGASADVGGESGEQGAGVWLTLSYEDEDAEGREAVSGLLVYAHLPLTPDQLSGPQPSAHLCARFSLKPEGVTLNSDGRPIVVFDQDSDRKRQVATQDEPQRFKLDQTEDYVWLAPQASLACRVF